MEANEPSRQRHLAKEGVLTAGGEPKPQPEKSYEGGSKRRESPLNHAILNFARLLLVIAMLATAVCGCSKSAPFSDAMIPSDAKFDSETSATSPTGHKYHQRMYHMERGWGTVRPEADRIVVKHGWTVEGEFQYGLTCTKVQDGRRSRVIFFAFRNGKSCVLMITDFEDLGQ